MSKPDNPEETLQRLVSDYADMLFRIALPGFPRPDRKDTFVTRKGNNRARLRYK